MKKNFKSDFSKRKRKSVIVYFNFLLFFVYILKPIQAQTPQPPVPACNGDHCNMYCHGDFEAFTPLANAYYPQSGLTQFSINCGFGNLNTVDIVVDNLEDPLNPDPEVQNQFVCFGDIERCEGLYFPLEQSVPPGCYLMIEFRAATTVVPTNMDIYGSVNPPCAMIDLNFTPGIPNPLCPTYTLHQIEIGIPIDEIASNSITLPPTAPNHPSPQYGENFLYHEDPVELEDHCVVWENVTNDPINFITIFHSDFKLYLDDIIVTRYCNELLNTSSTASPPWCSNDGSNTIEYEVCVDAEACDAPTIEMQASFPITPGVSFGTGGDFDPNGFLSTTVAPGGCSTVTLQIDLDDSQITSEINLDVTMDVTLTEGCYVETEQLFNSVIVLLAGDEPNADFTFTTEECVTEVCFTSEPGTGFTHLWEFYDVSSGTLLGTSIDETPCFDFMNSGSYIVEHTVSSQCWDDVTVSETFSTECFTCPCEGSNDININAGAGLEIGQTVLPPSLYNNSSKCIAIRGKLIVNEDYWLAGGEIRMQPGAEIVVTNGAHLTLIQINQNPSQINQYDGIHGCEQMWKGITVEKGSTLSSTFNVIQDAQHAISAISATPSNATIDVLFTLFDRNHIGIYTPPNISIQVVEHPNLKNNIFDASSDLLPPYDQLPNWDAANGFAGIEANSVILFVGEEDGSGNTFRNLRNGIVGNNFSWLLIYNNVFEDMVGNYFGFEPLTDTEGLGIILNQAGGIINHNTFNNMDVGIGIRESGMEAFDNTMDVVNTGINIQNPFNVEIDENTITAEDFGIDAINVSGERQFHVDENIINIHVANNPGINNAGIDIDGNGQFDEFQTNLRIYDNEITMDGSEADGISLNGIGGFGIWENAIDYALVGDGNSLFNGFRAGINLFNSDFNYVFGNTVLSNNADVENFGLEISMSTNNDFCCNTFEGMQRGVWFSGVCESSNLRHTSIGSEDMGLICFEATIGVQTDAGNSWENNYTSWSAFHNGSFVEVFNSRFLVELPVSLPLWPSNPYSPSDPNWFQPSGGIAGTCLTDEVGCPEPPEVNLHEDDDNIRLTDIGIANGDFLSSNHGAAKTFEGSRSLFRRIKSHSSLLGQDQGVDNFYQSSLNSNLAEFYDIENRIVEAHAFSPSMEQTIDNSMTSIESIISNIASVQSQLLQAQNQADSLVLYDQLRTLQDSMASPVTSVMDTRAALSASLITEANQIKADVANIVVNTVHEQNKKTTTTIYLETVAKGIFKLDPVQQSELEGIIWQCPLAGGDAVYLVRSLYQLVAELHYDDEALCSSPPPNGRQANEIGFEVQEIAGTSFKLQPNPARDKIFLSFNQPTEEMEKVTHVEVSTLKGKIVLQNKWGQKEGSLVLDISQLNSGIYFCSVFANNNRLGTEKLIILP